jgi:energy-coupling factor transporter ATP-binding protein EcfA2
MRINKISIRNFKAFHGNSPLIDIAGKNLLVYGENGAGKSSFALALRAILSPSNRMGKIVGSNPVNIFLPDEAKAQIKIETIEGNNLTNDSELVFYGQTYEGSRHSRSVLDASINGFLTYKQLLEIYFLPTGEYELNLYELLVKNLLLYTRNPVTNQSFILDFVDLESNMPKRNTDSAIARVKTLSANINEGLKKVLDDLTSEANQLLSYFNYGLKITGFFFQGLKYDEPNHCIDKTSENLQLNIEFCGEAIDNYSDILNEARLTALAICIYLASIKIVPEPELKVLILDDIMIGLDMGNRQPIVDILQNEFADWQIFFMTYDRFWFEKLKSELPGWKSIEMYADRSGRFPKPVILDSEDDFEKCLQYKKIFDYQASANYLRKAYEKFLGDFLSKYLSSLDHNQCHTVSGMSLQSLWDTFEKVVDRLIFNKIDLPFETIKSSVLNPYSHYDLNAPIYIRELENAITFYEKISNISCEKKGQLFLDLDITNKCTGWTYTYTYRLEDPVLTLHNGLDIIGMNDPNVIRNDYWVEFCDTAVIENYRPGHKQSLSKYLKNASHYIFNDANLLNRQDLFWDNLSGSFKLKT